jgi:methyl coenzyme M reductase gamma subunit
MLDLCKYYPISSVRKNYPATDCYFYADDDTKVLEDKYDEPLREIPIEDVIEILEKDLEKGSDYRRIYPTLAALKALNEHKHQWKELTVLHYGY